MGKLSKDISGAIERMKEYDFSHSIQIATNTENSQTCLDLAREHAGFIAPTIGIHPLEAMELPIDQLDNEMQKLHVMYSENCSLKPVAGISIVAFGEMGLDHFHLSKDAENRILQIDRQGAYFEAQMKFALEHDMPVVIHTRNCRDETLSMIKSAGLKKFVIHCYSEDVSFMEEVFNYSDEAMISFTGIVTYPKALDVRRTAQVAPLDRIMIETDAPYLIPEQAKGTQNYCEPAMSRYVLESIQELRNELPSEVEEVVYENSRRFFGV